MSTVRPHPLPTATASDVSAASAQVSRRRALLKGLAKGTAVLAVAVPIRTLATTTVTADKHLCSVSGAMSGVRSITTGMATCGGRNFSKFTAAGTWPFHLFPPSPTSEEAVYNGTNYFKRSSATFAGVFGAGAPTTSLATLFGPGTSDEAHWIVALLNAQTAAIFPYTAIEILAQYNAGGATRLNALNFYKTHMELL